MTTFTPHLAALLQSFYSCLLLSRQAGWREILRGRAPLAWILANLRPAFSQKLYMVWNQITWRTLFPGISTWPTRAGKQDIYGSSLLKRSIWREQEEESSLWWSFLVEHELWRNMIAPPPLLSKGPEYMLFQWAWGAQDNIDPIVIVRLLSLGGGVLVFVLVCFL